MLWNKVTQSSRCGKKCSVYSLPALAFPKVTINSLNFQLSIWCEYALTLCYICMWERARSKTRGKGGKKHGEVLGPTHTGRAVVHCIASFDTRQTPPVCVCLYTLRLITFLHRTVKIIDLQAGSAFMYKSNQTLVKLSVHNLVLNSSGQPKVSKDIKYTRILGKCG